MRRTLSGVAALALIALPPLGAQSAPLILQHITVIDGTGAPAQPDMTVGVVAGRIVTVQPAARFKLPAGATVVDGRGKFLLPGLWDMHVHMTTEPVGTPTEEGTDLIRTRDYYFGLLLANGVTGVRDMAGDLRVLQAWRAAVAAGTVLGPRIVATGYKIGNLQPVVPGAPPKVRTTDAARAAVRALKFHGADFVKVDLKSADIAPAVADEARKQGLTWVGHIPLDGDVGVFSDLGMRSVEHEHGMAIACSSRAAELRAKMVSLQYRPRIWLRFLSYFGWATAEDEVREQAAASYDAEACRALAARFVRNGTWSCPTLRLMREIARAPWTPDTATEQRYMLRRQQRRTDAPSSSAFARARQANLALLRRLARDFAAEGVGTLAGTDTPVYAAVPGVSLHEELEAMVEAGIPPLQALRAATGGPAEFLGIGDSVGTVAVGRRADLLILDADPVLDIRNSRRISMVVVGGKVLPRVELDRMMARAATTVAGR